FFQAEDGIRDFHVTGVQTCALPILIAISYLVRRDREGIAPAWVAVRAVDHRARAARPVGADRVQPDSVETGAHLVRCRSVGGARSEERRVGKECRCGWGPWW